MVPATLASIDRETLAKIDLQAVVIDPEVVRIAAGKYLRGLPPLFQVHPARHEVDEWELAVATGQWRRWADDHGYKTTLDIPDLIKHLLHPAVDFVAFKEFWNDSHIAVCLVNPDLDYMNTSKSWADHIAGYISNFKIFRKQKQK